MVERRRSEAHPLFVSNSFLLQLIDELVQQPLIVITYFYKETLF